MLGVVLQEYFAIVEYLLKKIEPTDSVLTIPAPSFYPFLDKNLYIERQDKLKIYRQLNCITCSKDSFTSVLYDKETKKTKRYIVINLKTYHTLKNLSNTQVPS